MVVDASSTADDQNSTISIKINNFNYTGDYQNEKTNEVACKDILSFDNNDFTK